MKLDGDIMAQVIIQQEQEQVVAGVRVRRRTIHLYLLIKMENTAQQPEEGVEQPLEIISY